MNRRGWLERVVVSKAALASREAGASEPSPATAVEASESTTPQTMEEIHRLLDFATMTGEDPLRMWKRLRETQEWLAGPLAPDGWAGQVFIADHADIFAFRFLSLPETWMAGVGSGKRAEFADKNF